MSYLAPISHSKGLVYRYLPPVVRRILLVMGLLLLSLLLMFVMIKKGWLLGVVMMAACIGLPIVWMSLRSPLFTILQAIFVGFTMAGIKRVLGLEELPLGTLVDGLIAVGFVGIILYKKKVDKTFLNPVSFAFLALTAYLALQFFNPEAVTTEAWIKLAMRGIILNILLFVVCFHAFDSLRAVKILTAFCLFMAALAGLYAIYQEWVGLPAFDYKWVMSDYIRYKLTFQGGRFRKWSFMSETSSFGVIMAYFSIMCVVMGLGPFKRRIKALLFLGAIFMLMGMAYSGTRTAYVMIPVGFLFYILLTITRKSTLLAAMMGLGVAVVILFGPFHGATINRLRSAVSPEDDASMQVRDWKRAIVRPYMLSHPFGGGVGSTLFGKKYHPGHFLAGFPPDSGYLMTALETGYIGLFFNILMYFIALAYGIWAYYKVRDPVIKTYYAAYMSAFFAISVGNIAQNAMLYPPANITNICIFILMFKMHTFEKNKTANLNDATS